MAAKADSVLRIDHSVNNELASRIIHVFGGVGFTWEHDAHLYYRRAWSAGRLAGGPQAHRAAISDLAGL